MPKSSEVEQGISSRRHNGNINENCNLFNCTATYITWYNGVCGHF